MSRWARMWAWVARKTGRLHELIEEPKPSSKLSLTRVLGIIVTINGIVVWDWLIFTRKEMVVFDATMAGIIIGFVFSGAAKWIASKKGDTSVEISGENPEVTVEQKTPEKGEG